MPKASIKLIVLLILMFLLSGIFVLRFAGALCRNVTTADEVGTPLVLRQEKEIINASITQVLETPATIYLVFGYQSVVQAYSLEGTYLYTVSVFNHINGRTEIAYSKRDDVLYISDKHRNIYAFSEQEYVAFTDKSGSWDLYSRMHFGRSSPNYSVKAGSVWYTEGDTVRCVVQQPAWQAFFQGNVLDLLLLFLLIAIGFVLRFPYPVKPK